MVFHYVVLGGLVVAAAWSVIEFALSADIVATAWTDGREGYLLFCSIVSVLLTAFLLLFPLLARRKSDIEKDRMEKWLAPVTAFLNAILMVFWLAAFATVANMSAWGSVVPLVEAQEGFAVLLWLIFLALVVLSVLSAFGVVTVDRPGYSRIFNKPKQDAPTTTIPSQVSEVA